MQTNQQGQVLLVLILLSTVLLTVALSVSQVTTQDTKISKLEEDSKRAFAAAEAGIEAQLKKAVGTTTTINNTLIPDPDNFITGSANTTTTTSTRFYTDIRKDDQYTFYLSNYNPVTKQFSTAYTGYLAFYLLACPPPGTTCPTTQPVIELTFIGTNSTNIARKLIDPANVMQGAAGTDTISTSLGTPSHSVSISGKTYYFKYKSTDMGGGININANVRLMLIRALVPDGSANTLAVAVEGTNALPPQGQTVTSTAQTATGVAKKITLFQSYPQIPADLFVTSF